MPDQSATTTAPAAPPTSLPAFDATGVMQLLTRLQTELPAIEQRVQKLDLFLSRVTAALPNVTAAFSSVPAIAPVAVPVATAADASNKTGLGAGILGIVASLIAAKAGAIGMPVGDGATMTGTVLPLASAATAALGAFGKLAPILRAVMAIL
jgi:hypothetical protein